MEKIRKNGLEKVINRHKAECSKIQPIVNTMLETGFCFTTDELKDLASVCSKLYKQAENMAKEEAARSKVKFRSNADYTETLEYLNDAVSRNADALRKALLYHTQNPLEIKAYEVTDGVVQVSSRWIEEKMRNIPSCRQRTENRRNCLWIMSGRQLTNLTHLSVTTVSSVRVSVHHWILGDVFADSMETAISTRKKKTMNLFKTNKK